MVPDRNLDLVLWWNDAFVGAPKNINRDRASLVIYTAWNIWKERNRGVFEGTSETPQRVLGMIKDELKTRSVACGVVETPSSLLMLVFFYEFEFNS
jgi:ABC-type histidine transport system ATPase subunit